MKKCLAVVLLLIVAAPAARAKVELKPDGFYVNGNYFYPVGVNYMPRDSAVYMWREWNPDEIRAEFKVLHTMRLNTIRTFIFWADLNPKPGVISQPNLDQINQLLDIARDEGLMVVLTLNTGHMSGLDWIPAWMCDDSGPGDFVLERRRIPSYHLRRHYRSIFRDALAHENALLQAAAVAERVKDHPALLYYDLGNEPQYFMHPPTPADGRRYVADLVAEIKKHDPGHPVALGMGKFAENTGFDSYGPDGIAGAQDLYLVHTYPSGYFPASSYPVDQYSTWYSGFEVALSHATGQPVQFEEFGESDAFFSVYPPRERAAMLGAYYRACLWGSFMAGTEAGTLAWMSGDYRSGLKWREPYLSHPHEMTFGVIDTGYQPKASGEELKKFAEVMAALGAAPMPAHDPVAIILPEDYQDRRGGEDFINGQAQPTLRNYNRALFTCWMTLRQLGINPSFKSDEKDCCPGECRLVFKLRLPDCDCNRDGEDGIFIGANELKIFRPDSFSPRLPGSIRLPIELTFLQDIYKKYLGDAGITPTLSSSESFVEAAIVNRRLVVLNHLASPTTVTVTGRGPLKVSRCFQGTEPVAVDAGLKFSLPAFGVEVCELGD